MENVITENFSAFNGDCIEVMAELPTNSIHHVVSSIPFASLFTYSASPRDLGNCKGPDEFFKHFDFVTKELLRIMKPGRLASIHVMNLPTSITRDGVIGLIDFRGMTIKAFQDAGWIFHSEVCIWKDPVVSMQRTKALGLLWKQLKKDSCRSRMGIPDYLITLRKPGVNPEPVSHTEEEFPVREWQHYASPVWDDIDQSDTLSYRSVREDEDEKHLCALQLEVIRRSLRMWSNEGDIILDPFGGIGSTGYVALQEGRKSVSVELKESYYKQLVANLRSVEKAESQPNLFAFDADTNNSTGLAKAVQNGELFHANT